MAANNSPTISMSFAGSSTVPTIRLQMLDSIDGVAKSTFLSCALEPSSLLGKAHTIIGIFRAITDEALNWDIYVDGVKLNVFYSSKDLTVSSLSGTRSWAVNTSNYNFSSQPAPENPMMLRNLCIFNFDVSAEGSPYTLADYQSGKSIPPSLLMATEGQRAYLNLENYTIARNTTTRLVKDLSSGGNDATITGDVRGDMDRRVQVFIDELKTQIAQSTATTTE